MAGGSLRRYDVQARYACVLSLLATVPLAAAAFATWQRYNPDLGQIVYGSMGYYLPGLLGCVLASTVPGTIGFVLGYSSAGKRRNDKQARSWIGFFVGGCVLTVNLILVIAFYMLRLEYAP